MKKFISLSVTETKPLHKLIKRLFVEENMKGYINPYIIKLIDEGLCDCYADIVLYGDMCCAEKQKHIKMLDELYFDLKGKPAPQCRVAANADVTDPVQRLIDEAVLFRTIYLALPASQTAAKNIAFEIMTDNMMCAERLNAAK